MHARVMSGGLHVGEEREKLTEYLASSSPARTSAGKSAIAADTLKKDFIVAYVVGAKEVSRKFSEVRVRARIATVYS